MKVTTRDKFFQALDSGIIVLATEMSASLLEGVYQITNLATQQLDQTLTDSLNNV